MIKAAKTSKKRLKDINLVLGIRSANNPLGIERTKEEALGIEIITLAIKTEIPYSSIKRGKRARGRLV